MRPSRREGNDVTHDREHPIDDLVRRAAGVDEDAVAARWAGSEAKQALLQEITAMSSGTDLTQHRASRPGLTTRRLVVAAIVATMTIGSVTAAVASLMTPGPSPGATHEVLERLPTLSLEACHTFDELAALVTEEWAAATQASVEIRAATRANISVPEEGPARLLDHADAGCAVVAATGGDGDGTHVVWIAPPG